MCLRQLALIMGGASWDTHSFFDNIPQIVKKKEMGVPMNAMGVPMNASQ